MIKLKDVITEELKMSGKDWVEAFEEFLKDGKGSLKQIEIQLIKKFIKFVKSQGNKTIEKGQIVNNLLDDPKYHKAYASNNYMQKYFWNDLTDMNESLNKR